MGLLFLVLLLMFAQYFLGQVLKEMELTIFLRFELFRQLHSLFLLLH